MMTHPHYLTLSLHLFFYSRNQMSFLHIIDNMCGGNNIEEGGTCTTMYTKYDMKFPKWSGDYKRSLDSIESLYLPESESISISEINRIQEYTEMFLDRYDIRHLGHRTHPMELVFQFAVNLKMIVIIIANGMIKDKSLLNWKMG